MIIFKTLVLSKMVFLAQVLPVPKESMEKMQCIEKDFLRISSAIKIKREPICSDFQNGSLTLIRFRLFRDSLCGGGGVRLPLSPL